MYVKCDIVSFFIESAHNDTWTRIGSRLVLNCNNCVGCAPMRCLTRVTVTDTDSVSVSGTATLSIERRAEVNHALAGRVGVAVSSEFSAGLTSTSTITRSTGVECGSANIPKCDHEKYYVDLNRRAPGATARLEWGRFYRCESWSPGAWSRLDPFTTCGSSRAILTGVALDEQGCRSEHIDCPAPQPDCCSR